MKKDRSPLAKFLNAASGIGVLESESAFTIAGDAAISKLASYRLPRRSAWILKVVQAAVAAEASELRITQSNKATTFTFDLKVAFQADEFREAMLDPEVKGARFFEHLATGLRSVGLGEDRACTMET